LYIADLGASVAEQLPKYFSMNGVQAIKEILDVIDIELQLICVVGGGNIFKATMEYLAELVDSVTARLKVIVAVNGFYSLSPEQETALQQYVLCHSLTLTNFDLVKDKGEIAMRTVENVLKSGKGTAGLSPFTSIYFKRPIEELNL
jgi:hypothetical protein